MPSFDTTTPVRALALGIPGATGLFDRLGIDYSCGGATRLEDACAERGLVATEVLDALVHVGLSVEPSLFDPTAVSLADLCRHIVVTHHAYTREALDRVEDAFERALWEDRGRTPELDELYRLFRVLAHELVPHMDKEECVIFPYVARMEDVDGCEFARATPYFKTVRNPIRAMRLEHHAMSRALELMRELAVDYRTATGASAAVGALFESLEWLEFDLRAHLHLENNVLFPRAIALEAELRGDGTSA